MREELEWIRTLSRTNREDNKRIKELHESIFGYGLHVCITCPASIRDAVKRLKQYYLEHYAQ